MSELSNNEIKAARKAAKLSQAEMSERLEIPLRTIEDWETGKRKPPDYVKRLIINELERIQNHGE